MRKLLWGAVAGGVGAAATGVAVGAAARKRSHVAAERRRLATQLASGGAEPGMLPPGDPSSVTADDGIRLSCEEIEPAGGPADLTVVLVHGFALDRRTWHFQRRSLAELAHPTARLVLYDMRSHGRSERAPRATCTIDQLGFDLDAVIRALAPTGPLVLVGHSMGGMTIMALAEERPELFADRVVGVVFIATSAGELGTGAARHPALPAQPADPKRGAARAAAAAARRGRPTRAGRRHLGDHPQLRVRRPEGRPRAGRPRRHDDQHQRG